MCCVGAQSQQKNWAVCVPSQDEQRNHVLLAALPCLSSILILTCMRCVCGPNRLAVRLSGWGTTLVPRRNGCGAGMVKTLVSSKPQRNSQKQHMHTHTPLSYSTSSTSTSSRATSGMRSYIGHICAVLCCVSCCSQATRRAPCFTQQPPSWVWCRLLATSSAHKPHARHQRYAWVINGDADGGGGGEQWVGVCLIRSNQQRRV